MKYNSKKKRGYDLYEFYHRYPTKEERNEMELDYLFRNRYKPYFETITQEEDDLEFVEMMYEDEDDGK
jgi:cytoplasmic iron level regulating protein YaaA (DUF328/UPF0246 family)